MQKTPYLAIDEGALQPLILLPAPLKACRTLRHLLLKLVDKLPRTRAAAWPSVPASIGRQTGAASRKAIPLEGGPRCRHAPYSLELLHPGFQPLLLLLQLLELALVRWRRWRRW